MSSDLHGRKLDQAGNIEIDVMQSIEIMENLTIRTLSSDMAEERNSKFFSVGKLNG